MKSSQYAIIGGTGIYDSGVSSFQKTVQTEYGEVEVDIAEVEKYFYSFPCSTWERDMKDLHHLINYRANLKALQMLGVKQIFATAAVGSLNQNYPTGSMVVCSLIFWI